MTPTQHSDAFSTLGLEGKGFSPDLPHIKTGYEPLHDKVEEAFDAIGAANEGDDKVLSVLEYALRRRELEAYLEDLGYTGAYKPAVFHSDLGAMLRSLDFGYDSETGHMRVEGNTGYEYWPVAPDNFQIVNTVAGHAVGTRYLCEIVAHVSDHFEEAGVEPSDYRIYRLEGGANFMVRVPTRSELTSRLARVKQSLNGTVLPTAAALEVAYPPNLIMTDFSVDEAIEVFNKTQDLLASEGRELFFPDNSSARKTLGDIIRVSTELGREAISRISIVEPVAVDILKAARQGGDVESISTFYQTFASKFFPEGFLSDPNNLIADARRVVAGGLTEQEFIQNIKVAALDAAERKVAQSQFVEAEEEKIIVQIALAEARKKLALTPERVPVTSIITPIAGKPTSEFENEPAFDLYGDYEAQTISFEEAEERFRPEGVESALRVDQAIKAVADATEEQQLVEGIRFAVSAMKRVGYKVEEKMTVPSGEVDIYEYAAANIRVPGVAHRCLELLQRDVSTNKRRRDALTGMEAQPEMYTKLVGSIKEALIHRTNLVLLFGDGPDIGYVNGEGGYKVGNLGIKMIASGFDAARKQLSPSESKKSVGAYRYGGDEFVAILEGDHAASEKFQEIVQSETGAYKLPSLEGVSTELFEPCVLRVNFGECDLFTAVEGLRMILAANLYSPEEQKALEDILAEIGSGKMPDHEERLDFLAKNLANMMLRISDSMITFDKGPRKVESLYNMYSNLVQNKVPRESRYWRIFDRRVNAARKALHNKGVEGVIALYEKHGGSALVYKDISEVYGEIGGEESRRFQDAMQRVIQEYVFEKKVNEYTQGSADGVEAEGKS